MGLFIDDSTRTEVSFTSLDPLTVSVDDFAGATGWVLKPEGFCRGDVCVPVRDSSVQTSDGGINVQAAATALRRSAVFDSMRGIAALGESARDLGDQMSSLVAPDFTLPDIDGNPVSLHSFNRRKVLLLAWSSW